MLLTGKEILAALADGRIVINPFTAEHLSANSYDVTLAPRLLTYDLSQSGFLDMREENPTEELEIGPEGLILEPNRLYLGSTIETATSDYYAPMFEGRSSIGRLGINTHITAGFGDVGWGFVDQADGSRKCTLPTWTLEIAVVHPVKIYPNVRIGQVYFFQTVGERTTYQGKYHYQRSPQASLSHVDFEKGGH